MTLEIDTARELIVIDGVRLTFDLLKVLVNQYQVSKYGTIQSTEPWTIGTKPGQLW